MHTFGICIQNCTICFLKNLLLNEHQCKTIASRLLWGFFCCLALECSRHLEVFTVMWFLGIGCCLASRWLVLFLYVHDWKAFTLCFESSLFVAFGNSKHKPHKILFLKFTLDHVNRLVNVAKVSQVFFFLFVIDFYDLLSFPYS